MGLRPKAVLGVGLALAALLGTLVYWQDIRSSATKSLAASGKAARRTISASVEPASSVRCNRISLPKQYYNATTAPYNPAAMQHPATNEWFLLHTFDEVSFALSEFAKSGENLAEVLNTHPLLLKLGYGEAPSMRRSNYDSVAMLEYDGSYLKAALEAGGEWFKAGDWRPFAWKGEVYLAHWIIFAPGEERMAISAVDEAAGRMRLAHVLSPLAPAAEAAQRADGLAKAAEAESLSAVAGSTFAREKNWGLVEDRGRLVVFHALLPCTVALEFDLAGANASAPGAGARVAARACFTGGAAATAAATGLDILRHPIHGSGNPVPWDIERGGDHREFLGMLHVKQGDYAHWAVRIDRAARRVTHVSAGPVIKARDYRNEGFLKTALVVGSFHMLDRLGEEGPERVMRIMYGEGDRFGCWLDVAADAIVWHALDAADGAPAAPLPAQSASNKGADAGAGATIAAPAVGAEKLAMPALDGVTRMADQWLEHTPGSGVGSAAGSGDADMPAGGADQPTAAVGRGTRGMEQGGPRLGPHNGGLSGAFSRATTLHRRAREVARHGSSRRGGPARQRA